MAMERVTSKTDKAIKLLMEGRLKESLSIFKTFKVGFTKDERRTIIIASESLNGFCETYKQLGIDTDKIVEDAKSILTAKYIPNVKVKC